MDKIFKYENGKKRSGEIVLCKHCKESFIKIKNSKQKFCSVKCSKIHLQNRIKVKCAYCNKELLRTPNKIKASKSGLFFCSHSCLGKARRIENSIIKPSTYKNGISAYRLKAFRNNKHKCVDCDEVKLYLLVVHHIDGNRKNNKLTNLEIVCSNCHRKRHLKVVNGEFIYDTSSLTDRDLIHKI